MRTVRWFAVPHCTAVRKNGVGREKGGDKKEIGSDAA